METLRANRNKLYKFRKTGLPKGIFDNPVETVRTACEKIKNLLETSTEYNEAFYEELLIPLAIIPMSPGIQSEEFAPLLFQALGPLMKFAFHDSPMNPSQRHVKIFESIATWIMIIRDSRSDEIFPLFDWRPVITTLYATFKSNTITDPSTFIAPDDRIRRVQHITQVLAKILWFNPDEACMDHILENLQKTDFDHLTSIDIIYENFAILAFFKPDSLVPIIANPDSGFWYIWNNSDPSPPWIQPRVEMLYFLVLAKLKPIHWEQILLRDDESSKFLKPKIQQLFQFTLDYLAIPTSASSGTVTASATVEVTGINRVFGIIPDFQILKFQRSIARFLTSLMWTSTPSISELGFSFFNALVGRTEKILLASSMSGRDTLWPLQLVELIQGITNQWLRRKLKAEFENKNFQPDHEKFVSSIAPGIFNVVKAFVGASLNSPQVTAGVISRYVAVFADLTRISPNMDISPVTDLLIDSISDPNKAFNVPAILTGGLIPLLPTIVTLTSDSHSEILNFIINFSPNTIDVTNLHSTIAVVNLLDHLFTQIPNGFTLYDLSCESSDLSIPPRLASVSSTFPDWCCLLVKKYLAVALAVKKPNIEKLTINPSSSQNETFELILLDLLCPTWVWMMSNVDPNSTLTRIVEIVKEFLQKNLVEISSNPNSVAKLIKEMVRVIAYRNPTLAAEFLSWLVESKIKPGNVSAGSLEEKHLMTWFYITGQAVRMIGIDLLETVVDSLLSKCSTVLLSTSNSISLKKTAIKTIQRICECATSVYIREFANFPDGRKYSKIEWWRTIESSGKVWYNPLDHTDRVKTLVSKITQIFSSRRPTNIDLRLNRAILYGCSVGRDLLQIELPGQSFIPYLLDPETLPDHDDNKRVKCWLKTVRAVMPHALKYPAIESENLDDARLTLAELSGYNKTSFGKYEFVGKDFQELDDNRFEFLTNDSEMMELMYHVLSGQRPGVLDGVYIPLFQRTLDVLLASLSDKNLVLATNVVADYIMCVRVSGEMKPRVCELSDILLDAVVGSLGNTRLITLHQARSVSAIFSLQMVQLYVFDDFSRLKKLLDSILNQFRLLGPSDATGEISDRLLVILNDLWQAFITRLNRPVLSPIAPEYVLSLINKSIDAPHWKQQLATLISAYMVWRTQTNLKTNSVEIANLLSRLLATGDSTPLSSMISQLIVHWLGMLLVHDNAVVVGCLSGETLRRVAKNFSLIPRFSSSRKSSMTDPESSRIDEVAKRICQTDFNDFCKDLFLSGTIPRVFNKGIVEHRVVFWWLLGETKRREILPEILSLIPSADDSGHADDDVHCTVLEFFASSKWESTEYGEWSAFLKKEIVRGDSSLIPTIATAVRMSVGKIETSSLEPNGPDTGASEWMQWLVKFLLSNFDKDAYRFSSVLNHAILIDPKMCVNLLASGQKFAELVDYEKFRSANDQVREVHSAAIGRLARVDPGIACIVKAELERVSSIPVEDEREYAKQKIAVLKALGRFIRFSRSMPDWCSGGLRLALDLVPNNQEDVAKTGRAFVDLTARFIGVDKVLKIPINFGASLKEIEAIMSLKVRVLVKAFERGETSMSALELVDTFQSNVAIDASMQSGILTAYKSALIDLLVLVPVKDIEKWINALPASGQVVHVLGVCAVVSHSSLYHDMPPISVKAMKDLAGFIETHLDPGVRKIAETTVSELMKILSDRGTRENAEKCFDNQTLSIIKSGRAKQSYIS